MESLASQVVLSALLGTNRVPMPPNITSAFDRHFVAFALERTMRVSFRDFHLQYEPSLKRERIPEHMFQLLSPIPSPKPVFEPAPAQQPAVSITAGAAEAAEAGADAAVPNGTNEAADGTADVAPMEAVQQQEPQTEAIPQLALDLLQQVSCL